MPDTNAALRKELVFHLTHGHAHAPFEKVIADFPEKERGAKPEGMPYSAWQLLEHIRITQRDILDFSTNENGSYKELSWPDEYWPKSAHPPSSSAWDDAIGEYLEDRRKMEDVIMDSSRDLFATFPWGDGQTLLRESILIVDHTSYHLGEILALRRVLNIWPAS